MKLLIALAIFAVCAVAYAEYTDQQIDEIFKRFRDERNKHLGNGYSNRTMWLRARENIKRHLLKIEAHNARYAAGLESYEIGYPKRFFDRTSAIVRDELCKTRPLPTPRQLPVTTTVAPINNMTLYAKAPASLDWSPYMSPVKNQLSCGSCWAFATVASVEGRLRWKKTVNANKILSPQQLVDCSRGTNNGCNGGWSRVALETMRVNGTQTETVYPYKAVQNTCAVTANPITKPFLETMQFQPNKNEQLMMNILAAEGPVVVAIQASSAMMSYKSGVFTDPLCTTPTCMDVNHSVVLVGYGTDTVSGKKFWKIL